MIGVQDDGTRYRFSIDSAIAGRGFKQLLLEPRDLWQMRDANPEQLRDWLVTLYTRLTPAAFTGDDMNETTSPAEQHVQDFASTLNALARTVHQNSVAKGFWHEGKERGTGTTIALMHSELSEALEALRAPVPDRDLEPLGPVSEKCPPHLQVTEELADCIIRILDFAAGFELDIGEALVAKMLYNSGRPQMHGGKKF